MSSDQAFDATGSLELYWLPGCSSCLRMKEFVAKLDVPYESVNLAAEPARAERLAELGLQLPAAVLGNKGVSGTDLSGIAELVGREYVAPIMASPFALKQKYDGVMAVVADLIERVPDGLLDLHLEYESAGRQRSLRNLILHIATIMRGFVVVEETNFFTGGDEFVPANADATATCAELQALAVETVEEFDEWWRRIGYDDPHERFVDSSQTRTWTLHEALERAVWHTAHHARQFEAFLRHRGIEVHVGLSNELLADLPLPDGVNA